MGWLARRYGYKVEAYNLCMSMVQGRDWVQGLFIYRLSIFVSQNPVTRLSSHVEALSSTMYTGTGTGGVVPTRLGEL